MVETAWAAWHRRGKRCVAALTMGNIISPFLLQGTGWKTVLRTHKPGDALLEKYLQADTLVSNSIFKNRGVDFPCFSGCISTKDNCIV